jgi:filamin
VFEGGLSNGKRERGKKKEKKKKKKREKRVFADMRFWTGCNTFLVERMLKIEDFCDDFTDGIQFCNLLEVISGKSLPKWNKKPRIKAQKLENVANGLNFLEAEGIKLVGIGPQDVVDPKLKLILGLVWTIILRYQIQRGEDDGGSARSELLKWVRSKIPEYDIKNFGSDWQSGKAICALAQAVEPENGMNLPADFTDDPLQDATMGMTKAEENMLIPMVLDPDDMTGGHNDELSTMTYISYFRDYENKRGDRDAEAALRRTPVASQCRAFGPGLETGEVLIPGLFVIEARNHNGEMIPLGGFPFSSEVIDPQGKTLPVTLVDNGDGTVNASYTPERSGHHIVHVRLSGEDIGGAGNQEGTKSPWKVPVEQAEVDPTQTKVYGPGVEGGEVGSPAVFTVETFNRFGTKITEGGAPVNLNVDGPTDGAKPQQKLVDNGDGTYTGEYNPVLHGDHIVNVDVKGEAVDQCPITVHIDKDPNAADAGQSWAEHLNEPTTIEPVKMRIHAVKPNGEEMKQGGEPFDVEAIGPEGDVVPATIVDNGDGTYDVDITAEEPGAYNVDLFLRNKDIPNHIEHIKDFPKTIMVDSGVSAEHTICEGPGLEDGILDTQPTFFNIETRDGKGRPVQEKGAGQPFVVKIDGPNGDVPATVTDNGDGTYRVDYEPTQHGNHHIEVTLKDQQVAKSPYDIRVDAGAFAANTVIKSYSFVVETRTRDGTPKGVGGEEKNFEIAIDGPGQSQAGLQDAGNGDYIVTYELPQQGTYNITVKINGENINGSPFTQAN